MTTEETIKTERDMLDALQFALNAFLATANISPDGEKDNKSTEIKNLRLEAVKTPSKETKQNWVFDVSYQEIPKDNTNSTAQEDFLEKFSRNRRFFKQIVVNKSPLKIVSIGDVE